MIQTKRVYEPKSRSDGTRFLIDRLWPRGIKKEDLHVKAWLKDVAPSNELRHWYEHEPAKWPEFKRRYRAELKKQPEAWKPILAAARRGTVTLLYSSKETKLNNATALKEYLERKLRAKPRAASAP